MSQSLAWCLIWVAAVWPAVLLVPYVYTRFRKREVKGGWWLVFYLVYTAVIVGGLIVHYNLLGPDDRPKSAFNYRGLGWRAGLGLTSLERCMMLETPFSVFAALCGYLRMTEFDRWVLRP